MFLTQKLAIHRNIQSFQTLTKSHDSISSWAGFGSALATLRNQLSVSASIFGTLKIAGYLGCVSILHISIPAVFSVETFNSSVSVDLDTWGYPGFNATNIRYAQSSRKITLIFSTAKVSVSMWGRIASSHGSTIWMSHKHWASLTTVCMKCYKTRTLAAVKLQFQRLDSTFPVDICHIMSPKHSV